MTGNGDAEGKMENDVYIGCCEACQADVYGIMTSSYEDTMTILFECHQCGAVWSVERNIGSSAPNSAHDRET